MSFPREANAVFVRMPNLLVDRLHRHGWQFYKFIEPDIYRLMCSWSVTEKAIEAFIADVIDAEEKESEHSRAKARQTTAQP